LTAYQNNRRLLRNNQTSSEVIVLNFYQPLREHPVGAGPVIFF